MKIYRDVEIRAQRQAFMIWRTPCIVRHDSAREFTWDLLKNKMLTSTWFQVMTFQLKYIKTWIIDYLD